MTSSCDMVWRAMLSCLSCQSSAGYAEWSMRVFPTNSVSTDHVDASSAVVKLAEEMDDVLLRHGVESYALLSLLTVECWLCGMVDARDSHEQCVDRPR